MTGSTYRAKSLPSLAENSRVSDRGAGGNPRSLNAHRCPVRHEVPFCFRLVRVRGPSGVAVKPVDTDARAELRLNSPKPSPSASEWVRCLDPINPPPIGLHSRPFRSTSSCQPTRPTNTRPAASETQPAPPGVHHPWRVSGTPVPRRRRQSESRHGSSLLALSMTYRASPGPGIEGP